MTAGRRHSAARPNHDATGCRRSRAGGVGPRSGQRQWIQADIAVVAAAAAAAPAQQGGGRLWSAVDAAIAGWRAESLVRTAFFVRKPPGIRLRLLPAGPDASVALHDELTDWLDGLERAGVVRGWRFGRYDPEVDRFGGRVGMLLAHEHFDVSSRFALGFEQMPDAARRQASLPLLSVATINDLMARCVGDAVELGDTWVRVDDAVDTYVLDEPVTARLDPQQVFSALAMEASWLVALPEEAHDLLVQTRRDNELVAGRVRAATTAGRLDAGLCGWLADLCLFHWNRVGLPADTARPLASTITAVLRRPL